MPASTIKAVARHLPSCLPDNRSNAYTGARDAPRFTLAENHQLYGDTMLLPSGFLFIMGVLLLPTGISRSKTFARPHFHCVKMPPSRRKCIVFDTANLCCGNINNASPNHSRFQQCKRGRGCCSLQNAVRRLAVGDRGSDRASPRNLNYLLSVQSRPLMVIPTRINAFVLSAGASAF